MQEERINSGISAAQVSARWQPSAHVTSSPVVELTERAGDVNMTSSQVLEDGDSAMVNGGYFE